MRKLAYLGALVAMFSVQSVWADNQEMTPQGSQSCATIASKCLDAGYTREDGADKQFWQGCMKPIILGNQVQGVTIGADVAKACRADKIASLKKELVEFEKAS